MQGAPRGLRQRWARDAAARTSPASSPQRQTSDEELEGEPFVDAEMGAEDEDLTMRGELEIEVPPAKWPVLRSLPIQKADQAAREDLGWLDRFAREQAQAHVRQGLTNLRQPWERGPLAGIFDSKLAWAKQSSKLGLPSIGAMETLTSTSRVAKEPALPSSSTTFAHQRVRQMRLNKTDDDVRRRLASSRSLERALPQRLTS